MRIESKNYVRFSKFTYNNLSDRACALNHRIMSDFRNSHLKVCQITHAHWIIELYQIFEIHISKAVRSRMRTESKNYIRFSKFTFQRVSNRACALNHKIISDIRNSHFKGCQIAHAHWIIKLYQIFKIHISKGVRSRMRTES